MPLQANRHWLMSMRSEHVVDRMTSKDVPLPKDPACPGSWHCNCKLTDRLTQFAFERRSEQKCSCYARSALLLVSRGAGKIGRYLAAVDLTPMLAEAVSICAPSASRRRHGWTVLQHHGRCSLCSRWLVTAGSSTNCTAPTMIILLGLRDMRALQGPHAGCRASRAVVDAFFPRHPAAQ